LEEDRGKGKHEALGVVVTREKAHRSCLSSGGGGKELRELLRGVASSLLSRGSRSSSEVGRPGFARSLPPLGKEKVTVIVSTRINQMSVAYTMEDTLNIQPRENTCSMARKQRSISQLPQGGRKGRPDAERGPSLERLSLCMGERKILVKARWKSSRTIIEGQERQRLRR
jgi:hypothetical protein